SHDVEILVGAFTRFGVVVVQAERIGRGFLQEVDDVAILTRAFREARALGRTLRRHRLPGARVRQRTRLRRVAGWRAWPGFEDQRRGAWRLIHEADADAA